jgi:hypothetical protein
MAALAVTSACWRCSTWRSATVRWAGKNHPCPVDPLDGLPRDVRSALDPDLDIRCALAAGLQATERSGASSRRRLVPSDVLPPECQGSLNRVGVARRGVLNEGLEASQPIGAILRKRLLAEDTHRSVLHGGKLMLVVRLGEGVLPRGFPERTPRRGPDPNEWLGVECPL